MDVGLHTKMNALGRWPEVSSGPASWWHVLPAVFNARSTPFAGRVVATSRSLNNALLRMPPRLAHVAKLPQRHATTCLSMPSFAGLRRMSVAPAAAIGAGKVLNGYTDSLRPLPAPSHRCAAFAL
jgi:hypothetical protein